jgi:predicted nuclease of predicted toxin-antitoxin system
MKVKLDENLPTRLAAALRNLGHDVHTTREEGLAGHPDEVIWNSAQRELRFLVTQDMDFSDSNKFAPGIHCGILLVRLHSPSWEALINRVVALFRSEDVTQWERCFLVATDRKLRLLKPQ